MSSVFGVGNAHFRTGGKSGHVDTVAFGAYRREVFERVGFFDEELARNQDDEFNYRVVQGGFKIFLDPAIQSDYFVRGSISKLYKQYDQYGYWKVFVNYTCWSYPCMECWLFTQQCVCVQIRCGSFRCCYALFGYYTFHMAWVICVEFFIFLCWVENHQCIVND